MKKATSDQFTPEQQAELDALAAMPDEQINTEDAPELPDWSAAQRGLFYRPIKQQITLRLDADVVAWFKHKGGVSRGKSKGYQTLINHALREYVAEHRGE